MRENRDSRHRRPATLALVVAVHLVLLLLLLRSSHLMRLTNQASLVLLSLAPPRPTTAPQRRHQPPGPRDSQFVAIAPATPPPVRAPSAEPPAVEPPPLKPQPDWRAETSLAAQRQAELALAPQPRALDQHTGGGDLNGGLPEHQNQPQFGWHDNRRVQPITQGGIGILVKLNDNCALVFMPLPFVGCGIGKIPPRGDLLDHMHDEPQAEPSRKNIAP